MDAKTKPLVFFLRYLAVVSYDLMLVIALFFLATAILLPFTEGEAIKSSILYPLYLWSIGFIFYGWFWTHGGQTLGLRAWKLKIVSEQTTDINWRQAFIRYLSACLSWSCAGLGVFWLIWQKDHKTWHDIFSKSKIINIPPSSSE